MSITTYVKVNVWYPVNIIWYNRIYLLNQTNTFTSYTINQLVIIETNGCNLGNALKTPSTAFKTTPSEKLVSNFLFVMLIRCNSFLILYYSWLSSLRSSRLILSHSSGIIPDGTLPLTNLHNHACLDQFGHSFFPLNSSLSSPVYIYTWSGHFHGTYLSNIVSELLSFIRNIHIFLTHISLLTL